MTSDIIVSPKKRTTAFLLCLFLGWIGAHRFYVGKFGTGILMWITGGGCFIWWFIDFIVIVLDKFKDKDGRILS